MNVAFREPNESTPALDAIAEALLLPSGIDGVYARTAMFEDAVDGLSALISRHREPRTEVLRFPPVMSRRQLEKSSYLKSFPHFLGCVCCLGGPETEVRAAVDRFEAGEEWTPALSPADLVLSPAACYPSLSAGASRGEVPAQGLLLSTSPCDCFRREPSKDLDRLQSFRMREYVCVGSPEQINDFRRRWMTQAQALAVSWACPGASNTPAIRSSAAAVQALRGDAGRATAEVRAARSGALRAGAGGMHELQLSSRPFRPGLEPAHHRRRNGAHRLRRFRHRPAGVGAVRDTRLATSKLGDAAVRKALML
jgi:hypothetical protein